MIDRVFVNNNEPVVGIGELFYFNGRILFIEFLYIEQRNR